ncbi:murein hydrolase activator EnvC family protein [Streptomyces ambofaciens]|uniref:murein hydrolase activator EnvC family protein n=1 Tax=Streptomyces ambofaciens TaxID=1889 RepID=UPI00099E9B94|nr:M23 family metallopeptidase [Streptomyces ambofaciens]
MRVRRWVSAGGRAAAGRAGLSAAVWLLVVSVIAGPPRPASSAASPAGVSAAVPLTAGDAGGLPDPSVPAVARVWPVGARPPVLRGWEAPATPYGPGHRGVDLATAAGASVRTVAAGRVSFAGRVAGRGVVSVELTGTGDPPLRTTYEPLEASVTRGDEVAAGEVLGTVEPTGSHCTGCLHWGLLRGDVYLNPLSLLPPWLLDGGPSRLLPVLGVPLPHSPGPRAAGEARGPGTDMAP